jgi:two-component system, OmpR family, phosphate regulon sensor histidine kinase PhoR
MTKKRLIWHIYPSYVILSILAMAAVVISASRIARSFYYDRTDQQLTSACHLIGERVASQPDLFEGPGIDSLCKTLSQKSKYRITVILPDGTVVGDSQKDPATMDNHKSREEVLEALSQGVGRSERHSDTLKHEMMYVAVPLTVDSQHQATIRTSLSLSQIGQATARMWRQMLWNGLVIALIAMAAALLISRRISRPLEQIRQSAESLSWDSPQERLPSSDISEVDILITSLNSARKQLRKRLNTIQQQHDEQLALLTCMTESVLAVDAQKQLIKMNQAAETQFNVKADVSLGKNIMEVIRNADLLDLVNKTFASGMPEQKEIILTDTQTYLMGNGSVLHRADGRRIGAVIVLNDITKVREMEQMRRDFVADVSHELRTPITSILGFAETLRDTVVEDASQRDHFLDIVYKQSVRLQTIVEDLLALSNIEDETEKGEIDLHEGQVATVVQAAAQACQGGAEEKQIRLESECAESPWASMNLQLLQQAVMNLIENAVKFSEPESTVRVQGVETDDEIGIQVCDQGPGIAQEHHGRLFERFYRVDKGRSRRLGGTGLGLAIVKHIALAHNGRVSVESEYGKGSTFSIWLPKVIG